MPLISCTCAADPRRCQPHHQRKARRRAQPQPLSRQRALDQALDQALADVRTALGSVLQAVRTSDDAGFAFAALALHDLHRCLSWRTARLRSLGGEGVAEW